MDFAGTPEVDECMERRLSSQCLSAIKQPQGSNSEDRSLGRTDAGVGGRFSWPVVGLSHGGAQTLIPNPVQARDLVVLTDGGWFLLLHIFSLF